MDGQRYNISTTVHTLSGYSAYADQTDLLRFIKGVRKQPKESRLVHGDELASYFLNQ